MISERRGASSEAAAVASLNQLNEAPCLGQCVRFAPRGGGQAPALQRGSKRSRSTRTLTESKCLAQLYNLVRENMEMRSVCLAPACPEHFDNPVLSLSKCASQACRRVEKRTGTRTAHTSRSPRIRHSALGHAPRNRLASHGARSSSVLPSMIHLALYSPRATENLKPRPLHPQSRNRFS